MQVCEGGWEWVHARRPTGEAARPGPGPAGFRQKFQVPPSFGPDPAKNPIPFFKMDHFALLAERMSTHVVNFGRQNFGTAKKS